MIGQAAFIKPFVSAGRISRISKFEREYTVDDITRLAASLGELLQTMDAQVTTAESCTGGGIAEAITRIGGSSGWSEAGYVTYSNNQKTRQL
ncbi:CinA family protein, partial [Pseudomonas viridiflava]|uniref:CinA family protein n=1 Tax=Pseudomonas viridiflava TaxID=33069 RepID=UPI001F11B531